MVLAELQSLLKDIYALEIGYDVYDFLITDEALAARLDRGGRSTDEKLLISELEHGAAEVSLFLHRELVERLQDRTPIERLDRSNLEDFWTALEGVSHFTYYAFNAALDKSVTLLEMELQAEVDKFIGAALLLQRQGRQGQSGLHRWLFDVSYFDARLTEAELHRYQAASRYAGKYCLQLAPLLRRGLVDRELKAELRAFYRMSQPEKIRHIEA